jgi:hypothetical protein
MTKLNLIKQLLTEAKTCVKITLTCLNYKVDDIMYTECVLSVLYSILSNNNIMNTIQILGIDYYQIKGWLRENVIEENNIPNLLNEFKDQQDLSFIEFLIREMNLEIN